MDVLMLGSVLFGWWYVALPIGIIALFRFEYYAELLVAGFAYDALFGMGAGLAIWTAYAGTITALAFLGLAAGLKGSIR